MYYTSGKKTSASVKQQLHDREAKQVKVYNVEKKELIGTFRTYAEAATFAGIDKRGIGQYVKHKRRCHTNKLGFTICFR